MIVNDTLAAYQMIAARSRIDSDYKVAAVTGSVGKTSTREFIACALSGEFKVHKTRENFNNEIGLPKTLLEAPDDCDICVVEMAMRAQGQIRDLTMIAKPDIAVITNIGMAHIGLLGSREAIFKAKTEIVEGLRSNGTVVLNCDDPMLLGYSKDISGQHRVAAVYTGRHREDISADLTVRCTDVISGPDNSVVQIEMIFDKVRKVVIPDLRIPVPGSHNISNALLGIAVAAVSGASAESIRESLGSYMPVGNRQRVIRHDGITIIDDTYNAGPESMKAAIDLLMSYKTSGRHIAVLGGMLELGRFSRKEHGTIGRYCADKGVDMVFAQLPEAQWYVDGAGASDKDAFTRFYCFEDRASLTGALKHEVREGDVLMVKGSRGFQMEEISAFLTGNSMLLKH